MTRSPSERGTLRAPAPELAAQKTHAPESAAVSPWKRKTDRLREREVKRDAVLRVAAQLFNEKGYHATSLDEVAERLNVTKPTVYHYVRNKEEILFECVRIGIEMLHAAVERVGSSGGTAMEKLIAAIREYTAIAAMDFGMCVIRVGEDPLPPDSRKQLRRLKRLIDQEFRSVIAQGIVEGSLAPCDPKIAAFVLAGALSWIARWYRPDGPLSLADITEQCIGVLMRGLQARGRPVRRAARKTAARPRRRQLR
jgi:AcrR family transcriptional regulator